MAHRIFFSVLLCASVCFAPALEAQLNRVTSDHNFSTDTTVTMANTEFNDYSIIEAGSGVQIGADPGVVVTIEHEPRTAASGHPHYGIYAKNGGRVMLGETIISSTPWTDVGKTTNGAYAYGSGSYINLGDGTKITAANNAFAVTVENGGEIEVGNNAELIGSVMGNGYGAVAITAGTGHIKIGDGAKIVNDGTDPSLVPDTDNYGDRQGVFASWNGLIEIGDRASITTNSRGERNHALVAGITAYGINGKGRITVGDDARIDANGSRTYGMVAMMSGSEIIAGQRAVINVNGGVNAKSNIGVFSAIGGYVEIGDGSEVTVQGDNSYGLYSQSQYYDPTIQTGETRLTAGNGISVTTYGEYSYAVMANNALPTGQDGPGAVVTLGTNSNIITSGDTSFAMFAYGRNALVEAGEGWSVQTTGNGSVGLYAARRDLDPDPGKGARIIVGGGQVTTAGDDAYGLMALGLESVIEVLGSLAVKTQGEDALGVAANDKGQVKLTGGQITTTGDRAIGVYAEHQLADGDTGIDLGNNMEVFTNGDAAHGLWAEGNLSSILAGNGLLVKTTGDQTFGLAANNAGILRLGTVDVTTEGGSSSAVAAFDGGLIQMSGGRLVSRVSGTQPGTVIQASGTSANLGRVEAEGQFSIFGDVVANDYGQVSLKLDDGSFFQGSAFTSATGAGNRISLSGANSTWLVTGHSNLSELTMADSTIDFQSAPLGTKVETGVLSGNGRFVLKTDVSAETADRVIITGSSNGNHQLIVVDQSSGSNHGQEVVDLIEAVDGGTWCNMDHPVDVGAWRYELQRTETGPGGAHVWQLVGRRVVSDTVSSAVNVFSGAYLLLDAENRSLIQRLGDLRHSGGDNGLWARVYGGEFESGAGRHVRGFDLDYRGLQVGFDRQWLGAQPGRGRLMTGAAFGLGRADLDYGRTGEGRVEEKSLSLYATWLAPHGFYVDLVGRSAWLANDFELLDTSDRQVRGETISTNGLGLSVETGKLTPIWQNEEHLIYFEPQVQYSFDRQSGNTFKASNGVRVKVSPFNSERLRTGVRFGYERQGVGTAVNIYGKASYVKEFDGDTDFTANGIPMTETFGSDRWLYGIGAAVKINQANAIHLDVERSAGGRIKEPWAVRGGWRWEF